MEVLHVQRKGLSQGLQNKTMDEIKKSCRNFSVNFLKMDPAELAQIKEQVVVKPVPLVPVGEKAVVENIKKQRIN